MGLYAETLIDRGQLSKALAFADKAIRQAPRDARGWYVRGRIRVERDQREGLADLRKAVELTAESNAQMLHWLATALIREKQIDSARAIQLKAVKLRPEDAEIREQLRQIEDTLSRK
jgi:tetratricopeptide (TPR) repeat protein